MRALQMDITAVFACGAWKDGFSATSKDLYCTFNSPHGML